MGLPAKHFYDFGPFQLDAAKRLLLRDRKPLPLPPKVIETLLVLVENHGQLVEKDELMKAVWPDTFVEEANLAVNISLLRKTLGGEENPPHYIETVPKRGYRFVAPVREHVAPQGASMAAPGWEEPAGRQHSWAAVLGLTLLAVVALGALLVGLGVLRKPAQPSAAGSSQPIHSVAVLPLQNLSGDPGEEYFADGLTEALVNNLAQVSALRVISRTSVMRYKGTQKPLPEIARELHVDAIVEGSVVRSGGRVRITAQLIEAATDTHLWARTYESDAGDLLAIQSRLAQAIVEQVRVTLTPEEKVRLATLHAVSPEAHEAYLKGRYFWNQRTPAALLKSMDLFQEAIRSDPGYAKAYAAVASAYVTLLTSDQFPPREMAAKATAAAEKALTLDETLPEPHADLAILKALDSDWKASDAESQRALELDPSYALAHYWYALMLSARGRYEEAYSEVLKAHELDPLSSIESTGVGFVLYWWRKYDPCIEQVGKVLELDPHFFFGRLARGECFEQKKSYQEAIADYQEALRVSPRNSGAIARLGHVFALTGRRKEALALLNELGQIPKSKRSSPWQEALIHIGLGDQERALDLLEKNYEQRGSGLLLLKCDPVFDPLRAQPRFLALLKKAGLEN